VRVAAIVLAAGRSTRMRGRNKLLAPLHGAPLVAHAVDAALASRARPVRVVIGHEAARVREALGERAVEWVENPAYGEGLSTSLRAAVAGLSGRVDGALVCLGDMPHVDAAVLDALIGAFEASGGRMICVPRFAGRRGNPVLWPATRFPDLAALRGDTGARTLLDAAPADLHYVPAHHDGVLRDVDTPDALRSSGTQ